MEMGVLFTESETEYYIKLLEEHIKSLECIIEKAKEKELKLTSRNWRLSNLKCSFIRDLDEAQRHLYKLKSNLYDIKCMQIHKEIFGDYNELED